MQCSVCDRSFAPRRRPFCASCARASLYSARIEQAAALLARENAHAHIEAVVVPGNDGILATLPEDADWNAISAGIHTHTVDRMRREIQNVEQTITSVTRKADELKQQMEKYKVSVQDKKAANERRREQLEKEKSRFKDHRTRTRASVESVTKKTQQRLDKIHKRTAEAREYLCREAASLGGLRKVRREVGKSEYRIAGLLLPDLHDLNGINGKLQSETVDTTSGSKVVVEAHEIVSAALDHIARLLAITCHYLSCRLPAQVILPHPEFPHTAVLTKDSSYRSIQLRHPSATSSQSISPSASRNLQRTDLSRPRLLKLDRPLPQLQKEDPKAALLFLEAITLLAYDIAWLCRAQGIEGIDSFTSVSSIGQNLYQLFYGRDGKGQGRPVLQRNISSATGTADQSATLNPNAKPQFGSHSHGSARNSLAGYEGFTLFRAEAWPPTVHSLTDRLKAHLRQEIARAEWHIIDDTEWDEEMENERAVLVGGARRPPDGADPAMSVLSVKPSDGTDEADLPLPDRGARGWMKVRGREGEA